jgi:bifunctional enzyme CysN/CysC
VRQIAVVVNKMDLVGSRQADFDAFARDLGAFLASIGLEPAAIIPVIGREGDNLATRSTTMSWYTGPTVLEVLDAFRSQGEAVDGPFRMPVQAVFKFTNDGDDRRIVAGTIDSGRLRVGDEVVFHPSGKRTRVKSLEAFNRVAPSIVGAGESAGFTLAQQIYVQRGELATLAHEPQPVTATRIRTSIFWLGAKPLEVGRSYTLKLGTARVSVHLEHIERVLDASTLDAVTDRTAVLRNEVAECVLKLRQPIAFDRAADLAATSRFVLVDNFSISGGGVVSPPHPHVRQLRASTRAWRSAPACSGSPGREAPARVRSPDGSRRTPMRPARRWSCSTTTRSVSSSPHRRVAVMPRCAYGASHGWRRDWNRTGPW